MLATTTYKMYYNGHYIRMFNLENCTDDHLSYYNQLLKSYSKIILLFRIKRTSSDSIKNIDKKHR